MQWSSGPLMSGLGCTHCLMSSTFSLISFLCDQIFYCLCEVLNGHPDFVFTFSTFFVESLDCGHGIIRGIVHSWLSSLLVEKHFPSFCSCCSLIKWTRALRPYRFRYLRSKTFTRTMTSHYVSFMTVKAIMSRYHQFVYFFWELCSWFSRPLSDFLQLLLC